ncbi:MAG TPA: AAA family ATPase, partial [Flavobacterium sp.]|nr:AAA family ATPase [Flavobacterium sp.]
MGSQNTLIDNDNSSFNLALDKLFNSDENLFIIGKAGTGKSTFLKYVVQKNIKKTIVLAPTGVAAMNVKGQTIHSFFKIPRQIIFPNDSIFESKKSIYQYFNGIEYNDDIIKKIELIIIDEVSMVRADLIDTVDIILRKIRDNNKPFGGVQVVLIGDLYQLSPVLPIEDKQMILDYYADYYIFNSNVFKNIDFVNIEFTKVYRQKGDNEYLDILNRIRTNTTSFRDFKLLNSRVISNLDHEINENNIILTGTNRTASAFNENFLNKNSNQLHVFDAKISGDFSKSDFIGEQSL